MTSTAWKIFDASRKAIARGIPTSRIGKDKEFHFQNWVYDRIVEAGYSSPEGGRNTYPDFPIEGTDESYEVKGITVGSREGDFDSNSAMPSGRHDGREVLYVFGRYDSAQLGGDTPRVHDLVIVHGSFLNAGGGFAADNKSLRVLGSYGDILLRDRKMYVPYTPYRLLSNLRGQCTLVLPAAEVAPGNGYAEVGRFSRFEADSVLVGYRADLKANSLVGEFEKNEDANREHKFVAYRSSLDAETPSVEPVTT